MLRPRRSNEQMSGQLSIPVGWNDTEDINQAVPNPAKPNIPTSSALPACAEPPDETHVPERTTPPTSPRPDPPTTARLPLALRRLADHNTPGTTS